MRGMSQRRRDEPLFFFLAAKQKDMKIPGYNKEGIMIISLNPASPEGKEKRKYPRPS